MSGPHRLSGVYQIINVRTGGYAALLNDDDRTEVVNVISGLRDGESEVSHVSPWTKRRYANLTTG